MSKGDIHISSMCSLDAHSSHSLLKMGKMHTLSLAFSNPALVSLVLNPVCPCVLFLV